MNLKCVLHRKKSTHCICMSLTLPPSSQSFSLSIYSLFHAFLSSYPFSPLLNSNFYIYLFHNLFEAYHLLALFTFKVLIFVYLRYCLFIKSFLFKFFLLITSSIIIIIFIITTVIILKITTDFISFHLSIRFLCLINWQGLKSVFY